MEKKLFSSFRELIITAIKSPLYHSHPSPLQGQIFYIQHYILGQTDFVCDLKGQLRNIHVWGVFKEQKASNLGEKKLIFYKRCLK